MRQGRTWKYRENTISRKIPGITQNREKTKYTNLLIHNAAHNAITTQLLVKFAFCLPYRMNFLRELKHPCRHDAQNDLEVRKITHTFSIKNNNISATIYSVFCFCFFFFFLLSLIERYLSPLFNEVIFRFFKKRFIMAFLPKLYPSLYFSLCNLVIFSREYCRRWRNIYVTRQR